MELKLKERYNSAKVKAVGIVAAGSMYVQTASAGTLNDSVSPVLADAAELMTPILTLVVATVGIIVTLAVIGFITGLFDNILGGIRLRR